MIPMQFAANVRLPYYGWFGRDNFTSMGEARKFVAEMIRSARRDPVSRTRRYDWYVRPHLLRVDE
jgi:hypothetical protein